MVFRCILLMHAISSSSPSLGVESMTDGHNNYTGCGYNDVFDEPAMGNGTYPSLFCPYTYPFSLTSFCYLLHPSLNLYLQAPSSYSYHYTTHLTHSFIPLHTHEHTHFLTDYFFSPHFLSLYTTTLPIPIKPISPNIPLAHFLITSFTHSSFPFPHRMHAWPCRVPGN